MYEAIIFDCFGVLAEDGWMPLKRKYVGDNKPLAQAIADLGKQNEFGMIDNGSHNRKVAELMGIDESILSAALGRRVPNEELFDFIKQKLKKTYRIGLLSNANFNVLADLFRPEQAGLIDASVMSYESRLIKPDERMFRLMADRLDADINQCIFVDDQERYCVAAENYGMRSIWYQDFGQFKAELTAILKS